MVLCRRERHGAGIDQSRVSRLSEAWSSGHLQSAEWTTTAKEPHKSA